MWIKKRKTIKDKIAKKFRGLNLGIAILSVFIGYMIVSFLGNETKNHAINNSSESLVESADRLADAFELYNKKRFRE